MAVPDGRCGYPGPTLFWTKPAAPGTSPHAFGPLQSSGMPLFLAVGHTLAFLMVVGWLGPGRCSDTSCLWVMLLFSLPALAVAMSVWLAARFSSTGAAIVTALVANLVVAVGGLIWFTVQGRGEDRLAQDAMNAVWFLAIGMVAGLLLIGYVRLMRRPRVRGRR